MFIIRSGQNEHSLEKTFHRCFLPSFSSFGWGISEEEIKMWKVNRRQTPKAHIAFGKVSQKEGGSYLCLMTLVSIFQFYHVSKFYHRQTLSQMYNLATDRNHIDIWSGDRQCLHRTGRWNYVMIADVTTQKKGLKHFDQSHISFNSSDFL